MIEFFEYSLLGVGAGLIAGLLGVGGGIVIVPVLLVILPPEIPLEARMHVAVASSLAVIVPASISSLWKHQHQRTVDWKIFRYLVVPLVLGAAVGSLVASAMPRTLLQTVFAAFEIIVAFTLLFRRAEESRSKWRFRPVENRLVSMLIGTVSAVLGVGGGTMSVPYFTWRGIPIKVAIGTSAACGFPIAIAGACSWWLVPIFTSANDPTYVYWPSVVGIAWSAVLFAPLGAMLTIRAPVLWLRRFFAIVLFATGIRLFYGLL